MLKCKHTSWPYKNKLNKVSPKILVRISSEDNLRQSRKTPTKDKRSQEKRKDKD